MANCCDPIVIPSCTKRCNQLVDACCVIDETEYPCIDPSGTSQCDINAAIEARICELSNQGRPCYSWTNLSYSMPFYAAGGTYQEVQESDELFCTVRLRGTLLRDKTADACVDETIFTVTIPPSYTRVFSINMSVTAQQDPNTCTFIPAWIVIDDAGVVSLKFTPYDASATYALSFDSIYYETV